MTPGLPSVTANDNNKNNYDKHNGKHNGDKCKDGCLGILSIMQNQGHARSKPWMPKVVDAIWRLCSRFGGYRWYSEWAPPMPLMINQWPKGNTAESLGPISCRG